MDYFKYLKRHEEKVYTHSKIWLQHAMATMKNT